MRAIQIDPSFAEAKVYRESNGFYMVKVSLSDIGLYITGIRVKESQFDDRPMWVQLPTYKAGRNWIRPFESGEEAEFKLLINELCEAAIREHVDAHSPFDYDEPPIEDSQTYEPTPEDLQALNEMEGQSI